MEVDVENLMKILLPRTMGKFTRNGLSVNGLHYHNSLYREQYLDGKECEVAYDPDMTNMVWVLENGSYIAFELIEVRFGNMDLEKVRILKGKQRGLVKEKIKNRTQAEIELAKNIGLIVEQSEIRNQESPSIKNIRANRSKEPQRTHKHLAREVGVNG